MVISDVREECRADRQLRQMLDREYAHVPFIGVSARHAEKNGLATLFCYEGYEHAVSNAGGIASVIGFSTPESYFCDLLAHYDGLIITGGEDVSPEKYGQAPHQRTGPPDSAKEQFEFRLIEKALERDMPIWAVCGGSHKLNIVYGGNLYQDLDDQLPGNAGHNIKERREEGVHPVSLLPGTLLSALYGTDRMMVNSTHHQAVWELGSGLRHAIVADDGVIEGFEDASHPFVVGVQFHPEALYDKPQTMIHEKLFAAFVNAARRY